jgi:hypothetical protein
LFYLILFVPIAFGLMVHLSFSLRYYSSVGA